MKLYLSFSFSSTFNPTVNDIQSPNIIKIIYLLKLSDDRELKYQYHIQFTSTFKKKNNELAIPKKESHVITNVVRKRGRKEEPLREFVFEFSR